MSQLSKTIKSRHTWKEKAIQRAEKLREARKTQKRYQKTIAELKADNKTIEQELNDKKKAMSSSERAPIMVRDAFQTRMLCVLLILQGVVSYRSVPRILNIMDTYTPLKFHWIPHFTDTINWTLRLGLGLLKQVKSIDKAWIAIIRTILILVQKKRWLYYESH